MVFKRLWLFVITIVLFSCTPVTDKNELLTSIPWRQSPTEGQQVSETITFQKDGTFISEAGPVKLNGKWSWKSENEIYLQVGGITTEGNSDQFDTSSNYFIRIMEISDTGMKTLERFEGDTWESGFAKAQTYTPQNL